MYYWIVYYYFFLQFLGADLDEMMVMEELLHGETLQKHLDEMRKDNLVPDLKLGLTLALQISNAMEELHNQDILHRDLKPGKIIYFYI